MNDLRADLRRTFPDYEKEIFEACYFVCHIAVLHATGVKRIGNGREKNTRARNFIFLDNRRERGTLS